MVEVYVMGECMDRPVEWFLQPAKYRKPHSDFYFNKIF